MGRNAHKMCCEIGHAHIGNVRMAERSKAPDSSDVVHYGGCRNSGLRTEAWVQIPLLIALLCCSSSFRKKKKHIQIHIVCVAVR